MIVKKFNKRLQCIFTPDRNPGPIPTSQYDFIKIAFKRNYEEIVRKITQTIGDRKWEKTAKQLTVIKTRTGIGGIEKHLEETQKTTNADITVAFQDLKKLMSTAKNMVNLSKQISQKIRVSFGSRNVKNASFSKLKFAL